MKLSDKARRRLTMLRDFFKTVPKKRIDLDTFSRENYNEKTGMFEPLRYKDHLSVTKCTAVGCLYGWATAVPTLRRAGLVLNGDSDYGELGAKVFDIPLELADDLFDAAHGVELDTGKSDKQIALARLRRVLRTGFDPERDSVFEG